MKKCPWCSTEHDESSVLCGRCRRRGRENQARFRQKNPEKYRELTKRSNERRAMRMKTDPIYREKIIEYRRRRQGKYRDTQREYYLKKLYGMTRSDFDAMVAIQEGLCGICRTPLRGGKFTAVDHSPVTGKVRGILCAGCNQGLGCLKEDPAVLRKAADYIERNGFHLPPAIVEDV